MQVARAIAEVVNAQVDRIVTGLECESRPLGVDLWGECRATLGVYLQRFEALLTILVDDYLNALKRIYSREKLGTAIEPDVEPFRRIGRQILRTKTRLDTEARPLVRVSQGVIRAPYFKRDLLFEHAWTAWAGRMEQRVERVGA